MNYNSQFSDFDRFRKGIKVTFDDQVRVLIDTITEKPTDADAYMRLGFIFSDEQYEKKDHRKAKEYLEKAISLGLDNLEIRLKLGTVLLKIRQYNDAVLSFRKALEFDSKCAEAYMGSGIGLFHLKQFIEAKDYLNQALILKKDIKTPEVIETLAEIHINLAKVAFEVNNYTECESECKEALKLKPDFEQGYIWLGNIYYAQKKYELSKEMFEKAMKLNPNGAEPHYYLGMIFERTKSLGDAEEEYRRAIEKNPLFANAYCRLGILLSKKKRHLEAILQLVEALKLNPDLIEAKQCLDQLSSQSPKEIEEAKNKTNQKMKEAELMIKEMKDWQCQSLVEFNNAIKEFNRAQELYKISHYYGYIEASKSADDVIKTAKNCVWFQKNSLGTQFYNTRTEVAVLLEKAKEINVKKHFSEDYEKWEREFSDAYYSFLEESFDKKSKAIQILSKLIEEIKKYISRYEKDFADEIIKKARRSKNAEEGATTGALIGAGISLVSGCLHCLAKSGTGEGFIWFVGHLCVGAILGAIIGAIFGYYSER